MHYLLFRNREYAEIVKGEKENIRIIDCTVTLISIAVNAESGDVFHIDGHYEGVMDDLGGAAIAVNIAGIINRRNAVVILYSWFPQSYINNRFAFLSYYDNIKLNQFPCKNPLI